MKKITFFSLVVFALTLTACGSAPIQNYEKVGYNYTSDIETDEIVEKILAAGSSLGWTMTTKSVSRIEATKSSGKEKVTVQILFKRNKYSIIHKSSENMDYDAEKNQASRTYNSWVSDLNNAIKNEIK